MTGNPLTPREGDSALTWEGAARLYEALADKHDPSGGVLTDYIFTRHGLTTTGELVLYCWLKHYEGEGA